MHRLHRHLRGLSVALVAVALSAGVALAARPSSAPPAAASDGLQTATEASGQTVPVTVEAPPVPDEANDPAEDPAEDPADDQGEDQNKDAPDGTQDPASRKQNHGWFVSQAAQADTPDGFANHGAYVSSIAKGDDGKPTAPAAATTGQQKAAAAKAAATAKAVAKSQASKHTNHGH